MTLNEDTITKGSIYRDWLSRPVCSITTALSNVGNDVTYYMECRVRIN